MPRYHEDSESALPQKIRIAEGDLLHLTQGDLIVKKRIADGGFGSVFKVETPANGEEWAFKIVYLDMASPMDFDMLKSRLFQEYKIGSLNSGYLIKSMGIGTLQGNPFLLMEYAPHGNLMDRLDQIATDHELIRIVQNVGQGLRVLHARSFVHRDIKPENILLGADGIYKLTDFGISANLDQRLTRKDWWGHVLNNEIFASPLYSPPEQLNKASYYKGTRPAMDIYSLGMVILTIVSGGKDPFGGEQAYMRSPKEFVKAKIGFKSLDPSLIMPNFSPEWKSVIDICLQPDPEDRYGSMDDFLKDLEGRIRIQESANEEKLNLTDAGGKILKTIILEKNGLSSKHEIRVGRNNSLYSENDINLSMDGSDVAQISKRHLTLIKTSSGLQVRDGQQVELNGSKFWRNSLNGTLVNGRKLGKDESITLSDGDCVTVGPIIIQYVNKK